MRRNEFVGNEFVLLVLIKFFASKATKVERRMFLIAHFRGEKTLPSPPCLGRERSLSAEPLPSGGAGVGFTYSLTSHHSPLKLKQAPLGRICNPAARNIRIYNPGKDV